MLYQARGMRSSGRRYLTVSMRVIVYAAAEGGFGIERAVGAVLFRVRSAEPGNQWMGTVVPIRAAALRISATLVPESTSASGLERFRHFGGDSHADGYCGGIFFFRSVACSYADRDAQLIMFQQIVAIAMAQRPAGFGFAFHIDQ